MPTLVDRLRALRGPSASLNGSIRLGRVSYNATAWGFARVASSVIGNPTGFRCIELLKRNTQRPGFTVGKTSNHDGTVADQIETHPLLDLLNNPVPTGQSVLRESGTMMLATLAQDLATMGKHFRLKMQGIDGYALAGPVTGLRRLAPQRVTVLGNDDDDLVGFIYTDRSSRRVPILPESLVYVRHPHPERWFDGLAPAVVAGLGSETDNAAARFNYDLLANDGAIPGYISIEGLTADEFRAFKSGWESGEYPGKTRFLGGKATYNKVGQTNQELAYDRLRTQSQEDIARGLGVPYVLINPTDATFANVSEAKSLFWQQQILGDLTLIADEFTSQLGMPNFGAAVGFDLDDIDELSEAKSDIVSRGVQLIGVQAYTVNKLLEQLGEDPVPWGNEPVQPLAPMKPAPVSPPGAEPPPPTATDHTHPVEPQDAMAELEHHLHLLRAGIQDPTPASQAEHPWLLFDRRVTAYELRAQRKMEAYFARQGRVIEARIRHGKGKAHIAALKPSVWWDGDRWRSELIDDVTSVYEDTVDSFGTATMSSLAAGGFDMQSERITAYITQRTTDVSGLVNDTTEADLRAVIADAEAQGLGIDEIADSVATYFADGGTASTRAVTFARTEVVGAANFGTLEGAKQSGVATHKTWLSTADDRVDGECEDLDGKSVLLDDAFTDGSDYPPAHPNCRCTILIESQDEEPAAAGVQETHHG